MQSSLLKTVTKGLSAILISAVLHTTVAQSQSDDCDPQSAICDPRYPQQWHLENTGQDGGTSGVDINVKEVWQNYKGEDVFIAIVDGTLDSTHEDLEDNVVTRLNVDYFPSVADTSHATGVAGILAARDNDTGIRGVAPRASIFNLNAIDTSAANLVEATAIPLSARQDTAVSNNSWATRTPFVILGGSAWQTAIETGLREGFHGRGTVYVQAAGNGFCPSLSICVPDRPDNSNLNGNANYHPIIAVCSINNRDVRASDSQIGANLWVCAPGVSIQTTSPGDTYTDSFSGTSAATPMVSGVVALMRQANPNLTWRDVRLILANSARKNDSSDNGWVTGERRYNSNGRYQFNHQYGFGVVNAKAAVDLAENWTNLPPRSSAINVSRVGLQNAGAGKGSLSVQSDMDFIEHVEIPMSFSSVPSFHDLSIKLKSPSGAVSELAIPSDQSTLMLTESWHFGSSVHLGEDPSGTWTVEIENEKNPGQIGSVLNWGLRIRGFQSRMDVSVNEELTDLNADGARITLHLLGAQWATTLSSVYFKLREAHPGLSIAEVNRVSDVEVELILAFDKDRGGDQISQNFQIEATVDSIAGHSKSYITYSQNNECNPQSAICDSLYLGRCGCSVKLCDPQSAICDPLYPRQWYLENTGQNGGTSGIDINVKEVWQKYKGEGVYIAIVDRGVSTTHPDLRDNLDTNLNHYYFGGTVGSHGTAVAGIAAARDNTIGVRGVAPRATMYNFDLTNAPFRSFEPNHFSTQIADAMTRHSTITAVSVNSWGATVVPWQQFFTLGGDDWRNAIEEGITKGFNGKGTVYVFAAGNDHFRGFNFPVTGENANYDGNANYHALVTVGAVTDNGIHNNLSEHGANLWLCAPADTFGAGNIVVTTSVSPPPDSKDIYTDHFAFTSAATPMVSGVVALMRQANPELTWRDVKVILANSATKNDPANDGWTQGAIKYGFVTADSEKRYHFNHAYGFGLVNAKAAVELAEKWVNLPESEPPTQTTTNLVIADDNPAIIRSNLNLQSDISFIETVEIPITFEHPRVHNLNIKLKSPAGSVSELAVRYTPDLVSSAAPGYWSFSSSKHLGEDASGIWELEIEDSTTENRVVLTEWGIKVRGFSRDLRVSTSEALTNINIDKAALTLTLARAQWHEADTLQASYFKLLNAPSGVSISSVARVSDKEVTVILAYDGSEFGDEHVFQVETTATAVLNGSKVLVSNDIRVIKDPCGSILRIRSNGMLRESDLNNSEVVLILDGFVWPELLEADDFRLNGVNGLKVASVSRMSDTKARLILAFSRGAEENNLDFDKNAKLSVVAEANPFANCDVPVKSNALTVIANPNPRIIVEEIIAPQCVVGAICSISIPNIFRISDDSTDFSIHLDYGRNASVFSQLVYFAHNNGLAMLFINPPSVASTSTIVFSVMAPAVITPNDGKIRDSVSTTFEFEIRPAGFPIANKPIPNQVISIGETFESELDLVFSDTGIDTDRTPLSYTLLEDPAPPSWISIEGSVLKVSVPDQVSEIGNYRIGISATDEDGNSTDIYFRLSATPYIYYAQLKVFLEGLVDNEEFIPAPPPRITHPANGTTYNLSTGDANSITVTVIVEGDNTDDPVTMTLQLNDGGTSIASVPTDPIFLSQADYDDTQKIAEFRLTAVGAGNTTLTIVVTDSFGNKDEVKVRVAVQLLGPNMVMVPAGSFIMGSPADEPNRYSEEGPQHQVTISQPFAVGKYEVTRGEFKAFATATGRDTCSDSSSDLSWCNPGFTQTDEHPVVWVSWNDAKKYVEWLSQSTGLQYRLLTEAEWEYTARAGTTTTYYFGDMISLDQANYGSTMRIAGTTPVGSYPVNAFGLYDMPGNVREWVEDCWHSDYTGAPTDGSAWVSDCDRSDGRVRRNGGTFTSPNQLRSAYRYWNVEVNSAFNLGFRIAHDL